MRGKANLIGRAMTSGMGNIPGAPSAMGGDEPDADDLTNPGGLGDSNARSGGPPKPRSEAPGIGGPARRVAPTKRAPAPPAKAKVPFGKGKR